MSDPIFVVGAGIGGLSAAIRLACAGKKVVVLEQGETIGGKMGELRHFGFRWDTGPSLITMIDVFEDLFTSAGEQLQDYLRFQPLDPLRRYFFPSGIQLDLSRDITKVLAQIRQINSRDVEGYLNFLGYAAKLYRITSPLFIYSHPPRLESLFRTSPIDVFNFDGLRTMNQAIQNMIHSEELRLILAQFATYVGASPYLAPATLNVIAHVELNQGLWYPQGGVYQIAEALGMLARKKGVEILTNQRVIAIEQKNRQVSGIQLENGEILPGAAVVANLDVSLVENEMLGQTNHISNSRSGSAIQDRSCSAFVMLLGVRGTHDCLIHHNTIFSNDYRREFQEIFQEAIPPADPTIYISITSKTTPQDAPDGFENWFIQVNVPALSSAWSWVEKAELYAELVLEKLAGRGVDIRNKIEFIRIITPDEISVRTGSWLGALYGRSSNNRLAAFRRPHNRSKKVRGLYYAGGTTHPGGGIPMVMLSGKVAADLLLEDWNKHDSL